MNWTDCPRCGIAYVATHPCPVCGLAPVSRAAEWIVALLLLAAVAALLIGGVR